MAYIFRQGIHCDRIIKSVTLCRTCVVRYHLCATVPVVKNSPLFPKTGTTTTTTSFHHQKPLCLPPQGLPYGVPSARCFSLAYLFTVDFPPVAATVNTFTFVHDMVGLPWWLSVILTTLTVRLIVTLPLAIMSQNTSARLQNLQPELKEKALILKSEVDHAGKVRGWSERTARLQFKKNMNRIQTELVIRDNCHPFKVILSTLVQLPIWIAMTVALRNMCGGLVNAGVVEVLRPDLALGGISWIHNLLLVDPLYVLPIITVITNLINIELGFMRIPQTNRFQKITKTMSRGVTFIFLPLGAYVPSCVFLYWSSSAVYTLIQNTVLLFPKVRRVLKIPETPMESKTPLKDMFQLTKHKLPFGSNSKE